MKAALIGTVIVGLQALVSSPALSASSRRSLTGTVTDEAGTVLKGAVVQLKNRLTLNIRSYITQSDGLYRFHGLHPDIDYEVKADYQGRSSHSRTLSRFDSKSNVRIDLQIPNGEAHLREDEREYHSETNQSEIVWKAKTAEKRRHVFEDNPPP